MTKVVTRARSTTNSGGRLTVALMIELRSLIDKPDWQADALCREYPDLEFFPTRGESIEPAKAVCRRCAVSEECLAYALERNEKFGMWGGTTERERRRLRRAREAA